MEEINFFRLEPGHEKINTLLTSMLTESNKISNASYQMKLSANDQILNYLIDNYIFEDAAQVQELNDLVAKKELVDKENLITIDDLEAINKLNNTTIPKENYLDLFPNRDARITLRLLNRNNLFNKDSVAVVRTLCSATALRMRSARETAPSSLILLCHLKVESRQAILCYWSACRECREQVRRQMR